MIPKPLEITLGGETVFVPPFTLRQLRELKDLIREGQRKQGLDVIETGLEIICFATGKSEDEITATVVEVDVAAQEVLKFAGFQVSGEVTGAPVKTPTSDGGSSTAV